MHDDRCKQAVTAAERFAERNGSRRDWTASRNAARAAASKCGFLAWATGRAACHAASVLLVRTTVDLYAETAAVDAANAAAGCNRYGDRAWIAARIRRA